MGTAKPLYMLFFISLLVGCKSTQRLAEKGVLDHSLTARQLIKENQRQALNFKTLQAKLKIDYRQEGKSQSYPVTLRMKKDEAIWINATLGLARAYITPEKVQFYDKINNQFFDGDYRLLSELLGVELDFKRVQNLLTGEAIFSLKEQPFNIATQQGAYALKPKTQNPLLELLYLLNVSHFKINSQQLYQPLEKRSLQIDYKAYQNVEKQIVPEVINITAKQDQDQVNINLEYKSVTLNQNVRFPFTIPSGFKEIVIKHAD